MANSSNPNINMETSQSPFRGLSLNPLTPGPEHTPHSYQDQTEHSIRDNNEAIGGGSRSPFDQNSNSQIKMRRGIKRKRETSGRSENRDRKRRKLHHHSGSDSDHDQTEHFVRDKAGGSRTSADKSSGSQAEMSQGVKRKRKTSDKSESQKWKRRRLDHQSFERPLREPPLYPLTPGPDHTPLLSILGCNTDYWSITLDVSGEALDIAFAQTEPSVRDNNEARAEGSRAPSDQSSDSQIRMRQGIKRKRQTSVRSESRGRKRRKLHHRSGFDSDRDQTEPFVRDHNEARAGGSRLPSDQSSDSQIRMRQGIKRKIQTSVRSENRDRKRMKLYHHSGSDSDYDQSEHFVRDHNEARAGGSRSPFDQSLNSQIKMRRGIKRKRQTSGRSESRERKQRKLYHRSGSDSDSDHDQTETSVRDNNETRTGGFANQSSDSQAEMSQGVKRKRKTSDRSESQKWKRRRLDHQSFERPLREPPLYPLTPGPDHTPLLSILGCNTDYWSITSDVSGEALDIAFAQTEPFVRDNDEAKAGGSRAPSDQSSDSQISMRRCAKRKRHTSGRSESRERKRSTHYCSCSDCDHDQTESSVRDNETRARESKASSDQRSGSQIEVRQGLKTKRNTSVMSESRERKRKRLDHQSGSNLDPSSDSLSSGFSSALLGETSRDEQNKRSRALSDQSSNGQVETRQGLKTKRKASSRSQSRKSTKHRLDHCSDSNEDWSDLSVRDNNEAKARESTASSDQCSGSQTEVRLGLKTKRKTSDRSESIEKKSKRLDHHSGFDYYHDQPGTSVRDNSKFRAGRSRAPSDQSSGSQVETRQGLETKRKASSMSQSTKKNKNRLDHRSDSNEDRPDPSVRDCNEARDGGTRVPSDQSSDTQVEMRKDLKTKRKASDRSESKERKSKRLDHRSDFDYDHDQPRPSVRDNSKFRAGRSRSPSDQSSGSQVENRQDLETKRKASITSQSTKSTKNRLDHRSDSNDDRPNPSVRDSNEARAGGSRAPSDQSSDTQAEIRQGLKTKRKASSRSQTRKSTKNRLDHHSDSHSNDDQSAPSHRENSEARESGDQTSLDKSRVKRSISELPDAQSKMRKSDDQSDSSIDSLFEKFFPMYTSTPPAACGKTLKRPEPYHRENSEEREFGDQTSLDESRQRVKRSISELPDAQSKKRKLDDQSDSSIDSLIEEFSRMYISIPPAACGKTLKRPEPSHRENSKSRAFGHQISKDESRQGVKRKRSISELPDAQSKKRKLDDQSDSSIDSLIEEFSRMYITTPPAASGKTLKRPEPSHRENSKIRACGDQIRQDKTRHRVKRKISEHQDAQSKRIRLDQQPDSSIDSLIEKFSRMYISSPPAACGEIATK